MMSISLDEETPELEEVDHTSASLSSGEIEQLQKLVAFRCSVAESDKIVVNASILNTRSKNVDSFQGGDSLRVQLISTESSSVVFNKLFRWPASLSNVEGISYIDFVRCVANIEGDEKRSQAPPNILQAVLDIFQLKSKPKRTHVQQHYLESLEDQLGEDSGVMMELQLWVYTTSNALHVFRFLDLFRSYHDRPKTQDHHIESMFFGNLVESIQASITPLTNPIESRQLLVSNNSQAQNVDGKNNRTTSELHWDVPVAVETVPLVSPDHPVATSTFVTLEYWVLVGRVQRGGFASLVHVSDVQPTRTLYLPFAPRHMFSFVLDRQMYFGIADDVGHAAAIDLSTFSIIPFVSASQPFHDLEEKNFFTGCSDYHTIVNPPFLVQWKIHETRLVATLQDIVEAETVDDYLPRDADDSLLMYKGYTPPDKTKKVFFTKTRPNATARMTVNNTSVEKWQSLSGQGWSLLSLSRAEQYFISWEGAKSDGAIMEELSGEVLGMAYCTLRSIMPERPVLSKRNILSLESIAVRSSQPIGNFVDEAIQSVLGNGTDTLVSFNLLEDRPRRLLRHCSTWRVLTDSQETNDFNPSLPIAVLCSESKIKYLSLRSKFIENGDAASFSQIVYWLASRGEYEVAACLSLQILHDRRTLRDLGCDTGMDHMLEGLSSVIREDDDDESRERIRRHVANVAVACMIKGGFRFAKALDTFLSHDSHYDHERACVMLASVAVLTIESAQKSDEEAGKLEILDSKEDSFWPLRALIQVGTSRDCLAMCLKLLDTVMPDKLRGRDGELSSVSSRALGVSIIRVLIEGAPESIEELLQIVEDRSGLYYWESLDHEAKKEFLAIEVNSKFPFLLENTVRLWCINQVSDSISKGVQQIETNPLSVEWLLIVFRACLVNGRCAYNDLFSPLFSWEEVSSSENVEEYISCMISLREACLPKDKDSEVDYDLIIAALLALATMKVEKIEGCSVPIRNLLNTFCYLSGRANSRQWGFSKDKTLLMKHCASTGYVQAGGNLIGGRNGIILECCDLLAMSLGWKLSQSEEFLLSRAEPPRRKVSGSFSIGEEQKHVCWLIDQYVVQTRKYGEFDMSSHATVLHPAVAANFCLRTWWCLAFPNVSKATQWIERWLSEKLDLAENGVARHRLACAALCRALLWPGDEEYGSQETLATQMKFSNNFLVKLAGVCCGLVESVPSEVALSRIYAEDTKSFVL